MNGKCPTRRLAFRRTTVAERDGATVRNRKRITYKGGPKWKLLLQRARLEKFSSVLSVR